MPVPRLSLLALFLLPLSITAVTLDCENIREDNVKFNLKELGGPKDVHYQQPRSSPSRILNTTFTIDICKPLKDDDAKKDEKCQSGTRVCAKTVVWRVGEKPHLDGIVPIAGEFSASDGANRALDPRITRLKGSAGNSDDKEGVIVELNGGKDPNEGTAQKAVIEFLCDKKLTGNEGFMTSKMLDLPQYGSMRKRAADDTSDLPDLDKGKSLAFVSYKMEDEKQVLRLRWKTKFACEDAASSGGGGGTGGWGFFTWFIIIVFLLAATYIIFGSWLNYNRYGARGWDLIPHGDTIRDIPYIIKDWTAGFGDRLKGQNSRGGYSAV